MRKGILSLIMPNQRRKKSRNIVKAETAASAEAEPVIKEPVPTPEPVLEEKPFVQRVYVPKTPSLLKTVTNRHDEMVKRARRQST